MYYGFAASLTLLMMIAEYNYVVKTSSVKITEACSFAPLTDFVPYLLHSEVYFDVMRSSTVLKSP